MKAFIFPGQGSQYVGMTDKIPDSNFKKELFNKASYILGEDLLSICENGPKELLTSTNVTQPAIFVTSALFDAYLKDRNVKPDILAGHSLGEYSALYSAQVFSFEDGVKLTKVRGALMKNASTKSPGKMLAVVGLDGERIEQLLSEASKSGVIVAANFNTFEQVVLSGETKAIEDAIPIAKSLGAKLARPLDVSAAFHSPIMQPVVKEMSDFIDSLSFNEPKVPVIQNVSAKAEYDIKRIKENLKLQLTGPVRWVDSILLMEQMGVDYFIEVGPKNVLKGLVEKILKDTKIDPVEILVNA
jgi:[acyl-carrier-protein] S-malonyltransferase